MREHRTMAKRTLLAHLAEIDGNAGATYYAVAGEAPPIVDEDMRHAASDSSTGSALFVIGGDVTLVLPPFNIGRAHTAEVIDTAPLVDLLERRRSIAVFLLRLGGFSVGFFRGEALVDSKTDQRFVKNRHRKGGQSQRRFERIREKQIDELFKKACETSRDKLDPYESEIEHVFLGGDRRTLQSFRKRCAYFERYGDRVMARVLHVPGDPRKSSLEAMPRAVWSSEVWTANASNGSDGGSDD